MTSSDRSRAAGQLGPVYEQPLNERMRTFLRLDFLYQQALYHEEREDQWSTRAAMSALLEILAITARGDIRSEVLKDLERQMTVMHDYTTRPGVDTSRLKAVLSNLGRLRTELNSVGALFMQRFQIAFDRENPCQLLRISLPTGTPLFPEISGSHHRCSIRFLSWNDLNSRPVQTTEDVQFQLTVCT
jgi:cell division FtsZ-interacting protein ZapD